MRLVTTCLLLGLLAAQPASAASLAGLKCESKDLIEIMHKQLKSSSFEFGVHIDRIRKAVTEHASRDRLICILTLQMSYSGQPSSMRVRLVYDQFSDGKMAAKIVPF